MGDHPVPEGWVGGSEDFTILSQNMAGHRSVNPVENNGRDPGDITDKRNDRRCVVSSFADNGTGYEADSWPE
jgi:hypothetical protein